MRARAIGFALALASCSGNGVDQHAECERAVAHLDALQTSSIGAESPAIRKDLEAALVTRHKIALDGCVADRWSAAAIACFASAPDPTHAIACTGQLSAKQMDTLSRAMDSFDKAVDAAAQRIAERDLAPFKTLLHRMCACADSACREAVDADLARLARPDDPVLKEALVKFDEKIAKCRAPAADK